MTKTKCPRVLPRSVSVKAKQLLWWRSGKGGVGVHWRRRWRRCDAVGGGVECRRRLSSSDIMAATRRGGGDGEVSSQKCLAREDQDDVVPREDNLPGDDAADGKKMVHRSSQSASLVRRPAKRNKPTVQNRLWRSDYLTSSRGRFHRSITLVSIPPIYYWISSSTVSTESPRRC